MVERLKAAIEKARTSRDGGGGPPERSAAPERGATGDAAWSALGAIEIDPERLRAERIVSLDRTSPASVAIDQLRTRLVKLCKDRGWRRIGIASPTKGCGKSVVSVNLAFSLARNAEHRTILLDLDLRQSRLHGILGVTPAVSTVAALRHRAPLAKYLLRHGENLAFGLNDARERNAAEVLQSAASAAVLTEIVDLYEPDILLCDLTPLLGVDDALAFLSNLDAVIIVAAAGLTSAREVEEAERLIGKSTEIIGIVLNKYDRVDGDVYAYAYDES